MAKEIGILCTFFGLLDSKYYVHMLIFWWKLNCMLCLSLWNYWSNAPTYCCLEKKGEPKASEAWIEKIPFHGNVQWSSSISDVLSPRNQIFEYRVTNLILPYSRPLLRHFFTIKQVGFLGAISNQEFWCTLLFEIRFFISKNSIFGTKSW